MPTQDPTSTSLSKKRARDRRAQKNMRDKRQAHIQCLENRIDHLESELRISQQAFDQLRAEKEVPRDCQRCANHSIVTSGLLTTWSQRPDLARASPDVPSAVDLLYGSQTNFLANNLHASMRLWPCRDPEHLGASFLTYHAIKWMLSPTEERYEALYEFQRPVAEQLNTVYPFFIDFVMWPALRANLIRHQGTYDIEEIIGMLVCCLKLRWPWNEAILEPEGEGRLRMKLKFIQTFSTLQNWTLTEEFWSRYPKLVEGMDRRTSLCDFLEFH